MFFFVFTLTPNHILIEFVTATEFNVPVFKQFHLQYPDPCITGPMLGRILNPHVCSAIVTYSSEITETGGREFWVPPYPECEDRMGMFSSVVRALHLQSMATGRASGHNNFAPSPIYYAPALKGAGIKPSFCRTYVCLSRTSGLS